MHHPPWSADAPASAAAHSQHGPRPAPLAAPGAASPLDASANLHHIAAVLRRESPDVVALQEADGPSLWSGRFDHIHTLSRLAGYDHSFRGDHQRLSVGWRGLDVGLEHGGQRCFRACRSPTPTRRRSAKAGATPRGSSPPRPSCRRRRPGRAGVSVDLDFLYPSVRRRQVEQLVEHVRHRTHPLVILGDFNCEWGRERGALMLLSRELPVQPVRRRICGRPSRPGVPLSASTGSWSRRARVRRLPDARRPPLRPPGGHRGGAPAPAGGAGCARLRAGFASRAPGDRPLAAPRRPTPPLSSDSASRPRRTARDPRRSGKRRPGRRSCRFAQLDLVAGDETVGHFGEPFVERSEPHRHLTPHAVALHPRPGAIRAPSSSSASTGTSSASATAAVSTTASTRSW